MAHIVEAQVQARLGGNLKAVYQAVVKEPVPERLRKLLDELERREKMSRLESSR